MSEGARCRSCGLENAPGRDFCERCGEYLAWAPTSMVAAVPEAPADADEATTGGGDDQRAEDGPGAAEAGAPEPAAHGAGPPVAGDEAAPIDADAGGAPAGRDVVAGDAPAPPPTTEGESATSGNGADAAAAPPGEAPTRVLGDGAAGDAEAGPRNGAPAPPAPAAGPRPASRLRSRIPKPRRAAPPLAAPPPADVAPPPIAEAPSAAPPPPPPPPPPPSPPAAPPAPTVPQVVPATGDASLVLAPADPAVGLGGVPAVDAGATLTFRATIRNESQIVDNYDLAVLGLPENWAVVQPAAAFLVPLGSGRGDSELELRIDITPPRDYRSTAGIWTFELAALSRTHATVAARAIAQFEVRPFQQWSIEVVPTVNSGRFKARYRAAVRNDGNAEQALWPTAIDDSGKLRMKFTLGQLTLDAGEVGADTLTLRPRIPKPVGRTVEHRVGVDVTSLAPEVDEAQLSVKEKLAAKAKADAKKAAGGVQVSSRGVKLPRLKLPRLKNPLTAFKLDAGALARMRGGPGDANAPLTARQVVYRQKPVIPLWFWGLLALIALILLLLYLLWPQKTTVPSLVGVTDSFVAEKRLRDKGLVLSTPPQRREDPNAEPNSVIEQSPGAGAEVDEGAAVSIVVAEGDAKVDVPRLKGLTRVKADERLREEGLELGETQPADAADTFIVKSQIPGVGLSVNRGTAVRVFLRKPPASKKAKTAAKKKQSAAAAAAAAKKKKAASTITIPEVDDKPLGEYVDALDKLGLKAKVATTITASKSGTVIAVDPAPGKKAKKGDEVRVRASSGPPPLAVQTDTRVLVVNPVGGKELFRLPGTASEPSYFPDGEQVVFRSGSRILLSGTGAKDKPSTIYSGPDVLVRPTVASDGATLALIRREEGDGDLCFGRSNIVDLGHLCLPDDGWDLDGRISWSRNGRAVLVPGRLQSDPSVFAVRVYRTTRAFTLEPLLWRGTTATPTSTPGKGVRAAVFSPGGTRIAAISNLETEKFEVVFAEADDLRLAQPKSTDTQACDVAWRSDGQELAVVQSDDCSEPLGKIVRFAVASPKDTAPVVDKGRNPVYRP